MPKPDHTAAITAVIQAYIEGMVFGDRSKIEAAFHENSGEVGHFDGQMA